MNNNDTRKKLIEITKGLLLQTEDVNKITARTICNEAGVNLAMINYCFRSKDELIKLSVDSIISEEFSNYVPESDSMPIKEQLHALLVSLSSVTIKYSTLTKLSIPYLMLQEDITLPTKILPYIRKYYNNTKDEAACRLMAFDLVYSLQLIFYRADDFKIYSDYDVMDITKLSDFIKTQLDIFLP